MSQHPNTPNDKGNTAAGKYQFIKRTWDKIAQKIGAKDFSPNSQDRAALQLLIDNKAIEPLLKGNFDEAAYAAAKAWDVFPGDVEGKSRLTGAPRNLTPIKDHYENLIRSKYGR